MYKRCVAEQSSKRQRELESGLLKAMSTHRYEDIAISQLCDDMNVPRKSFYRYFSSKEGALFALIDHTCMDFLASFMGGTSNATSETMVAFFKFWMEKRTLLDALMRSGLSGVLVQRSIALASTDNTVAKSFFPSIPDNLRNHGLVFMVSGLMSLVIEWHHSGFKDDPREMADIAATLLTKPLYRSGLEK
ncbi:MAG: TetR/AcrR family transcriptional regulator [Oscillospiraceae bacterium]|nr:TetR/AcrR family transcriptional regulator [Oscillospiraceae bacterium]